MTGPSQNSQHDMHPEDSGMHTLHQLINIIRARKIHIIVAMAIVTSAVVFKHFFHVPEYEAEVKIRISAESSSSLEQVLFKGADLRSMSNATRADDYFPLLKSDDFPAAVSKRIKTHEDFFRLRLISPGSLSFFGVRFWQLLALGELKPGKAALSNKSFQASLELSNSDIHSFISHSLHAETNKSGGITIRFAAVDPLTAMVMANTIASEFIRTANDKDLMELNEIEKYIKLKINETEQTLKNRESELIALRKRYEMYTNNSASLMYLDRLKSVEADIENVQIDINNNNKTIARLESYLRDADSHTLSAGGDNPTSVIMQKVSALQNNLDMLRKQKILLRNQSYQETDPQVEELDRQIGKTAARLKELIGNERAEENQFAQLDPFTARTKLNETRESTRALVQKKSSLLTAKQELVDKLKDYPMLDQEYQKLSKNNERDFQLVTALREKLSQLEIRKISLLKKFVIDQPAEMPEQKAQAGLASKAAGALAATFFLAVLLLWSINLFEQRIHDRSDLSSIGLHVLGIIPKIKVDPKIQGTIEEYSRLINIASKHETAAAMSFRYIRTHLLSANDDSGNHQRIFMVTSPNKGEGKSFVASSLAISLAQLDKHTLLVDCDFANPALPKYFKINNTKGLAALLSMEGYLEECLQQNVMPNLDVLPAGKNSGNKIELLEGELLKQLMDHIAGFYDFILLDAPAMIEMADAAIIGRMVDEVLLVAQFRKTRKHDVDQAHALISRICNKPCQVVLNGVSATAGSSSLKRQQLS